jgi:dTDP-glucose 4,6-dehydratase
LQIILTHGKPGETYNVGGNNEKTNVEVVKTICEILDELRPNPKGIPYQSLITHVEDRPGHDRRYAINSGKITQELGWKAHEDFSSGLRKTVKWYLDNDAWVEDIQSGNYQQWLKQNYSNRKVST